MTQEPDDIIALRHAATDRATIVTVPERRMIALDGVGAPSGTPFRRAIETLHEIADRLRARLHTVHRIESRIGAVECAWWMHPEPPANEAPELFEDRATWHWQLMIEVPTRAGDDDVEAAIDEARRSNIDHAVHVQRSASPRGDRRRSCTSAGRTPRPRRLRCCIARSREPASSRMATSTRST
jgi:hypothetical protein